MLPRGLQLRRDREPQARLCPGRPRLRRQPGQVGEGVDLPRDPLAPADPAAADPVRDRSRRRGEAGQRDPASDGGLGVRRSVPLRLRGAAHLAGRAISRPRPTLWTRRVTNLDDGLRYQCAARWTGDTAYPEWTCSNYAPVPGRGDARHGAAADYQTLDRTTRIVAYGTSWLERQDNVKTIHQDEQARPARPGDGQELVCAAAGCRVRRRPGLRAPAPGVLDPAPGRPGTAC